MKGLKQSPKGLFVTGTDTEVGKTFVCAGLAAWLRRRSVDVGVCKPVETGCESDGESLAPADGLFLTRAAGNPDPLDQVVPFCFESPEAPLVAARGEGRTVQVGEVLDACRRIMDRHQVTLVEGAGGVLVPLTDRYFYLDLIADLGIPCLLVVPNRLGSINHTLLTLEALHRREIEVIGLVINRFHESGGPAEESNPSVIEELSKVPVWGTLPRLIPGPGSKIDPADLADLVEQHLDPIRFLSAIIG